MDLSNQAISLRLRLGTRGQAEKLIGQLGPGIMRVEQAQHVRFDQSFQSLYGDFPFGRAESSVLILSNASSRTWCAALSISEC